MKIFDMHIHADGGKPDAPRLIERMEAAGVYGGAVFSVDPAGGRAFDARFEDVMGWTEGYEGRLFPVMWVHPWEENVIERSLEGAKRGIAAFKLICRDYRVYDGRSMELLRALAATGKPVIFHSGILWSGDASSMRNRPADWEHLIGVPALRFSMGHCAWPWVDECIAVYGKFLNSYARDTGRSEMFFDTTPGTPPIYRRELWYKLFNVGYDVPHNILYGTDSMTSAYRSDWVKGWLRRDNAIFDELGVSGKVRRWIFEKNFMRFLGLEEKQFTHRAPVCDNSNTWTLDDEADDEAL